MNRPKTTFLEAANAIGAKLCRDALWSGARCNWLGDSMEFTSNTWAVAHRSFGPDLYSGTSGVALFLAQLYQATGERLYRVTAQGGARQALSRLEDIAPAARIGFYSGATGIAYALIKVGEIFDDQSFIGEAFKILAGLTEDDPSQQGLDVIAGSAGAIPALLGIHRKYGKEFLVDLSIRHGEHLLATARRSEIGWSWNTLNLTSQQDLTGFSHGTAGIAWALLELSRATKQEKFREAAEQGFRYERHWFSAEHGNWPDFRDLNSPAPSEGQALSYGVAWCHGAPGIGLSRVRAYELSGEEVYRREAEAALQTTASLLSLPAYAGQNNYSLCHGLCGNAELLIYASQVLRNADYQSLADQVGEQGIEQSQQRGLPWPCGVPGGGETPGLMLGLAGIGYYYLRLYDPEVAAPVLIILP